MEGTVVKLRGLPGHKPHLFPSQTVPRTIPSSITQSSQFSVASLGAARSRPKNALSCSLDNWSNADTGGCSPKATAPEITSGRVCEKRDPNNDSPQFVLAFAFTL